MHRYSGITDKDKDLKKKKSPDLDWIRVRLRLGLEVRVGWGLGLKLRQCLNLNAFYNYFEDIALIFGRDRADSVCFHDNVGWCLKMLYQLALNDVGLVRRGHNN